MRWMSIEWSIGAAHSPPSRVGRKNLVISGWGMETGVKEPARNRSSPLMVPIQQPERARLVARHGDDVLRRGVVDQRNGDHPPTLKPQYESVASTPDLSFRVFAHRRQSVPILHHRVIASRTDALDVDRIGNRRRRP